MKTVLIQLAAYNHWANATLIQRLAQLPESVLHTQVESSFSSVFKTVVHMYNAETIWWQRVQATGVPVALHKTFEGSIHELSAACVAQSRQWEEWISEALESSLEQQLHYKNTSGQPFEQPLYQILLHVFNHATYHRGQIITMLRLLQVGALPATDFIVWSRVNKK